MSRLDQLGGNADRQTIGQRLGLCVFILCIHTRRAEQAEDAPPQNAQPPLGVEAVPSAQPSHALDPVHDLLGISPISGELDHALQFGRDGADAGMFRFADRKLGREGIGVVIRPTAHEHDCGVGLDADGAAQRHVIGVALAVEQRQYEVGPRRPGLHQRPDGVVVRRQGVAVLAPLGVEQYGRVVAGVHVVFGREGGEFVAAIRSRQAEVGRGSVGIPVVEVALSSGREDVVRRGGLLLLLLLGVLVVVRCGRG